MGVPDTHAWDSQQIYPWTADHVVPPPSPNHGIAPTRFQGLAQEPRRPAGSSAMRGAGHEAAAGAVSGRGEVLMSINYLARRCTALVQF